LGFNVIAFEIYMLSCYLANKEPADDVCPGGAIDCLDPMWNTQTVRRLFLYIA